MIFFQLDEINQLFLPHMRNKLLWFYQEVEEPEPPQPLDMVSLLSSGHGMRIVRERERAFNSRPLVWCCQDVTVLDCQPLDKTTSKTLRTVEDVDVDRTSSGVP